MAEVTSDRASRVLTSSHRNPWSGSLFRPKPQGPTTAHPNGNAPSSTLGAKQKGKQVPTTESSVAIFSYIGQDVRTVRVNGEPWFVLRDACAILGISNVSDTVARLDQDGVGSTDLTDSLGRPQVATIVSEAGLYELIFQSRRPEAKQFRRWVTSVVLPEIRQTGSYVAAETPEQLLSRALVLATETLTAATTELAATRPRAEAWDAIASAEGDYSVGDAAKILARAGIPTGPQRLFNQLADLKWTYRGADNRPRAYAERLEKGYLSEKPSFHYHPGTGERVVDPPQVRVTVKGIERLRQRLHVGSLQAVAS